MAELQKNELMRRIRQACFAAHECTLYLDGHPYNRKAMELHDKYVSEAKDLTAQYESRFGPLTSGAKLAPQTAGEGWVWATNDWPWQNREE